MQEIAYTQILILLFQCLAVGFILLSLYKLRSIFGLGLLFMTLGVFQYMQIFYSSTLYIEIIPGILVSPGSAVLFSGSLFAILLVYIREDALESRKFIYAILAANLVLSIMQIIFSLGIDGKGVLNIYDLSKDFFKLHTRILIVGALVLFLDSFLVIFLYEAISKFISSLFLRILFTMTLILGFDSLLFSTGAFAGTNQFENILVSGIISKSAASLIYSAMFTFYLLYLDKSPNKTNSKENSFKDIFHTLTYRQKYEQVTKEKEIQKIELKKSDERYQYFVDQTSEGFFQIESAQPIPINIPVSDQIKLMYKHMYVAECNDIYAQLFGFKSAIEIIGKQFSDIAEKKYIFENIESFNKFIKSNHSIVDIHTKIQDNQGKYRHFSSNMVGIIENENLVALWGTQKDITESKKNEIALLEANKIINKGPAVAFLWKNEKGWPVEFVTENIEKLCGYIPKDFIDKKINYSDIICKKDIERVTKEVEFSCLQTNTQKFNHEPYRIKTKNGAIKWVHDSSTIRRNSNGVITHYEGIVYDITEEIIAEEKVKAEKNKAQQYLNVAAVMLLSIDSKGTVKLINPKGCEILGYSKEEILGQNWFDNFLPVRHRESIKTVSKGIFNSNKGTFGYFENEVLTKSGEERLIGWNNEVLKDHRGKIIGVLSSGEDITERKLIEQALSASEEKFRSLAKVMPAGAFITDAAGNCTYTNPYWINMTGLSLEESLDDGWVNAIHPDDKEKVKKLWYNSEETRFSWNIEFRYEKPDGQTIWVHGIANPMLDTNGNLKGYVGVNLDITDQKKKEIELRTYIDRLQILHNIDKAILAAESPKNIASEILEKILKLIPYKLATVVEYNEENKTVSRIANHFSLNKNESINELKTHFNEKLVDIELLKKGEIQIIPNIANSQNGSSLVKKLTSLEINSWILIPLISENILIGSLNLGAESIDVFSKEQLNVAVEISNQLAIAMQQWNLRQELILYTEKLEDLVAKRTAQLEFSNKELRDFAQIVSHDLKAPLRAISQLSYWVSQDYADKIDEEGQNHLKMLISRVKRLDNLIDGILQYSRTSKAREKEVNINIQTIVDEVIISLAPTNNIKIKIENQLPEYLGDPTRISQLFQNLINNAIQSINKSNGLIKIGCEKQTDFWKFSISDNGIGIEEKYFDRIFQIFQRLESRDNSEGTGIGLTLVKRIVQIYGGEIWIQSKLGEGSTFFFTLPIQNNSN